MRQDLDTPWCDRGPRHGRLAWNAVAGAIHYEIELVATSTCCDFDHARWPEARWRAGRRLVVHEPSTPRARVTDTYFRVRAVFADRAGPWTHGMWECWYD